MSDKNINTLKSISSEPTVCKTFNDNFNTVILIHGYNLLRKQTNAGPITTADLRKLCLSYQKTTENIEYAVYTSNVIHIVFSDSTCLSVIRNDKEITYLRTTNDKSTWIRLQSFFYNNTSRYVSHAKKAPLGEQGRRTLDQMVTQYQSNFRFY